MSSWLNYHHLFYFKTIASEGSIAKAAIKLRLGQPTLSAQLKQFEEVLGVQLFERKHKRLELNESGRVALQYANEIFRLGGEMVEVLNDRVIPSRPHVQIGALDSVPKHLIHQVVSEAYRKGPCVVSVLEGKGDELIRELTLHRIDLFVSNYQPASTEGRGLYSKLILRDPVIICGAPKYRNLRKDFPRSLDRAQFALPTNHSKLRHDFDHYCRLGEIAIDTVAESQDMSLLKLLCVEGMGLIPAPQIAVADLIASGDLVEIGRPAGIFEEFYLVSASRKIENPISAQLIRSFRI